MYGTHDSPEVTMPGSAFALKLDASTPRCSRAPRATTLGAAANAHHATSIPDLGHDHRGRRQRGVAVVVRPGGAVLLGRLSRHQRGDRPGDSRGAFTRRLAVRVARSGQREAVPGRGRIAFVLE